MGLIYTARTASAITNLDGLASGAFWGSDIFPNGTELAFEVEPFITIITTTTLGVTGSVKVFVAGAVDGSNFAGNVNSSNAVYTPVGDDVSHLKPLDAFSYTAETTARTMKKRFAIRSPVPKDFRLVILNNTGAALGTGNLVKWNGLKY